MIKLPYLHHIQNVHANEDQDINVDSIRAKRTNLWLPQRGKPLFPNALSLCITQIRRFEFCGSRKPNRNDSPKCQWFGETIRSGRPQRTTHTCWARSQAHYGLFGRRSGSQSYRIGSTKFPLCQGSMAAVLRQRGERSDIPPFFIGIGVRYRRIRRGVPSPQLYAYKAEKLQELEHLYAKGEINLFYDDESHVCTKGYVPYGWQFPRLCEQGQKVADNIFNANKQQIGNKKKAKELSEWMVTSRKELRDRKDGLTPDMLGMHGFKKFLFLSLFNKHSIQSSLFEKQYLTSTKKQLDNCSGFLILFSKRQSQEDDWFNAGRELERIWLDLTNRQIAVHPMSQSIEELDSYNNLKIILNDERDVQMILRIGYTKSSIKNNSCSKRRDIVNPR